MNRVYAKILRNSGFTIKYCSVKYFTTLPIKLHPFVNHKVCGKPTDGFLFPFSPDSRGIVRTEAVATAKKV